MGSPLERVFYMRFDARGGTETALVAGRSESRAAPGAVVATHASILSGALSVLGKALRATGLLLVASPLFFGVKLVLAATAGPQASDIVIPFFVFVVVIFFALLDVALIVFLLHWLLRKRAPAPTFVEVALAEGAAPSEHAAAGDAIRARGRVVPLEAGEDVVVRSAEAIVERGTIARLVELRAFAVVADDDATPPVVVHGPWAPAVVARDAARERGAFGPDAKHVLGADVAAFEDCELLVIHAGDRVEVSGVVDAIVANADAFELDGAPASLAREGDEPYRGGAPRLALALSGVTVAKV